MPGTLGGVYAGYTIPGTMLGIPSRVYVHPSPSRVHPPYTPGRTCRTAARCSGTGLTALTHEVAEQTVSDDPLTVVPALITRFTVGCC